MRMYSWCTPDSVIPFNDRPDLEERLRSQVFKSAVKVARAITARTSSGTPASTTPAAPRSAPSLPTPSQLFPSSRGDADELLRREARAHKLAPAASSPDVASVPLETSNDEELSRAGLADGYSDVVTISAPLNVADFVNGYDTCQDFGTVYLALKEHQGVDPHPSLPIDSRACGSVPTSRMQWTYGS